MNFLIAKNFFKDVPMEKVEQVREKINYFYKWRSKNKEMTFNTPKGLWLKKLRKNLYEFRVNSGDRILFEFKKINRVGYEEEVLVLLLFGHHDMIERTINNYDKYSNFKNLNNHLELKDEKIKDDKSKIQEFKYVYNKINSKIMYKITSDDNLLELIKNEDEYTYYYLNDEQYNILNCEFPLFLKGSAGSGKTTVAIRKAMELEEYQEGKIGYITFTKSLKDKAQEMYEKFRSINDEKRVEFFSLEELYEKQVMKKPVGIKQFEKFMYEFNPTLPKGKGIENLELYQEIRGIIKGSMGAKGTGNWNRDLRKELISLEDYLALNKKYTIYSEEIREMIYKVAERYQGWLAERNFFDENDLARKVILNKNEIFDNVICDEVQDLTEVEIYMLKKIVKGGENLFFSGDIHQIINPTYFNFSRVKSLFYENKYTEKVLKKNYRSQNKIVDLANKLTDLRCKYIGKLGEDYKESAILDGSEIYFSKKDHDFLKKLEENTAIILVPTDKIKQSLKKQIPKIENKILTVQDVKGLEFDSVILYNFATEFKNYWRVIFSGEAKTNQLYRYYFNLLYVGITRARKRLLIMEEKQTNQLLDELKEHLVDLTVEGKRDFTLKSGEADFLKEGKEFLKQKLFLEAISAFKKAGAEKYIKKANNELEAENYFNEYGEEKTIEYIVGNQNVLAKNLEEYVVTNDIGDYAFKNKNYEKAKKYYKESENYEKLCKLSKMDGDLEESLKCASKSNIKPLIKEMEEEVGINNKALAIANEIRVLPDKKMKSSKYSLMEFKDLNRKYIMKKQEKHIDDILVILHGRFKSKGEKKYNIKSPTKLLIRLHHVEGGKNGINYLLKHHSTNLNLSTIVSILDSGNIIEKYISSSKNKIDLNSFLILSCENNMIKNTKKLLQLGANIEAKSEEGLTSLTISIKNKNIEMVKLLIEKSAELGDITEKTPLSYSIDDKYFDIEIFKYLLQIKKEINLESILLLAIKRENMSAVKHLIRLGAKLDLLKKEERLLTIALKKQNYKLTKLLINEGASLEKHKKNSSPMEMIIRSNNSKALTLFLDKNYKLSEKELKKLSKQNNLNLSKLVLIKKLGYFYFEKIEQKISPLKGNLIWVKSTNINKKIEQNYNFEKYKINK